MATRKQIAAARKNIRKAQKAWRSMSSRQHALAQPQGRTRAKPGSTGRGRFYRIVVRDKDRFSSFRNHDVGNPGHIQRLAGRRSSGTWATQSWLISKEDAHSDGERLVADSSDARKLLRSLGSKPRHVKGDVYAARDRRNIPESEKPTRAQREARAANIKKAQRARRKMK